MEPSEEGTAATEGAALSDPEGDDPSVPDAFRQIATELRGIDAPDAIRSNWEAMAAGLDRMADAFADVDTVLDLDRWRRSSRPRAT